MMSLMEPVQRKPRTLAVIRIPFALDSVDYRAYAERLSQRSVLTWALTRLSAAMPPGVPIVCVCATRREYERLVAASDGGNVVFLHRDSPSEAQQCQELMEEYDATRIIGLRLIHAVAPVASALRTMLQMHDVVGATVSEASARAFATGIYIMDSAAVKALREADTPTGRKELLPAASEFRADLREPYRAAIASRWFRLELPEIMNIAIERWPETIRIHTAVDIRILRNAVEAQGPGAEEPSHYIDAWKSAAITVLRADRERSYTVGRTKSIPRAGLHERRRVLYVSGTSYFHGASQSLCHLIEGLDRRRYEPFVAIPFEGVLTAELRRRGAVVICPNQSFDILEHSTLPLADRIVRETRPDVAHGNYDVGTPLLAALAAADVPIVQHVRQTLLKRLHLEIHAASAIVAVSDLVKKRLAVMDIDPDTVHVIWPGIDTHEFRPLRLGKSAARRELGIPQNEFVVAVIGRMARYKGHDIVVAALGHLRRATGRGHLLLVSALDGDRLYYDEVFSLIRQEGLTSDVTHIEFTMDVPTVLHASDSLAMMSNGEAFGRVAAEAMALGRPVVVGDATGAAEIIEQGINGFVVPSRDANALFSALAALAGDPVGAERIGAAATRTIQTVLSSAVCAEKTMAIYDSVLSERQSPRQGQ